MIRPAIIVLMGALISCDNPVSVNESRSATIPQTDSTKFADTSISETTGEQAPATWQQINDRLYSKFSVKIAEADLRYAISLIRENGLIDSNIGINNNRFPAFCYKSPTAMLDLVADRVQGKSRDNNFSLQDKQFMLEQDFLTQRTQFKWQDVVKEEEITAKYPQQRISIPVFSTDKSKFIICIEKHRELGHISDGRSYLFVLDGKKPVYYLFDEM
jgi:hypothetical protein